MSDHLIPEVTNRGFQHMPEVQAVHAGRPSGTVKVYESSAANGPHIWLQVNEQDGGCEVNEAHAHLPLEEAVKLRDQLTWLIEHHYQGGARRSTEKVMESNE